MNSTAEIITDAIASKLTGERAPDVHIWVFVQYDVPGNSGIALALTQTDALKIAESNIRSRMLHYGVKYDVKDLLTVLAKVGSCVTYDQHTYVVQSRTITTL